MNEVSPTNTVVLRDIAVGLHNADVGNTRTELTQDVLALTQNGAFATDINLDEAPMDIPQS